MHPREHTWTADAFVIAQKSALHNNSDTEKALPKTTTIHLTVNFHLHFRKDLWSTTRFILLAAPLTATICCIMIKLVDVKLEHMWSITGITGDTFYWVTTRNCVPSQLIVLSKVFDFFQVFGRQDNTKNNCQHIIVRTKVCFAWLLCAQNPVIF